jgi:uncharacterized protein (TIRG00374 family)
MQYCRKRLRLEIEGQKQATMTRPLQIIMTIIALAILASIVDWASFLDALLSANYFLISAALFVFTAERFLMSYKWTILLRPHHIRLGVVKAWAVYCMASLYGLFLPSTVGADAIRVWDLRNAGIDPYAVSASIVIERLIGFIVGLSLAALSLIYFSSHFITDIAPATIMYSAGVVVCFAVVGFFLLRSMFGDLIKGKRGGGWAKVSEFIVKVQRAYSVYRGEHVALFLFLMLTMTEQLIALAMGYLIVLALGIDVSLFNYVAAMAIGMLISRVPLTIDGLGVLEGTVGGMLVLIGVALPSTVAVLLIGRVLNVVAFLPGAVVNAGCYSNGTRISRVRDAVTKD